MTEWTPTTCMRCAVGCGHLQQGVEDGYGIASVRGNAEHPVNRGLACQRGIEESQQPEGEWLTEPLVRRGDVLKPVDWDTALGIVVGRFIEALANGTTGLAVLGSGQQTNEAAYALGKLARGGFGTRYYDANTTLCMASAVTAYYQAFGGDAPPPTYGDIPAAQTHVVWGANPAAAHPVLYRWIVESASEDGGRLIVVDPVGSETSDDADRHVRPAPGTDLALARAVLAAAVDEDLIDEGFVAEHTEGYEDLLATLPAVAEAADAAEVPVDTVEAMAEAFADPSIVYWGMGVNQNTEGTKACRALIDLCLATGNLGPGTGPFSLTGQANSMGTRVCSSKGTWPGHRPFDDPDHRKAVAGAWNVPVSRLPDDSGPGPVGIVDAMARGDVETCWTVATNPVAGMPNATYVQDALEDVFLVVQDAFKSETVEYADVVLPATTWGESEGTVMNMERTVSRVTAATDTPETVRSDLDIIAEVGHRFDDDLFDRPPLSPEGVFDEFRALTAGTDADLSGITYDRLAAELGVRWPASDESSAGGYRYYDSEADDWSFPTDSGLAGFSTARFEGRAEPPDDAYPLTLTTGRLPGGYNTGVRTRVSARDDVPVARLHPETVAEYIDVFDRGRTAVTSRRGAITVAVTPDDAVPPGMIWMDIHNPTVNELTLPEVDPQSNEPNYKQCAVAMEAPADTAPPTHHAGALSPEGQ
ncbi:nitrate reductase [Halobacteriales archaeon QS_4_66_20]|nr:MAG: nitrate reductase [Halobacteriales archaeon QS_4_66_20]